MRSAPLRLTPLALCLVLACDRKDPPEAPAAKGSVAPSAKASTAASGSAAAPSATPSAISPKKVVEGRTIHAWQGTLGKDAKFDIYLERVGDELSGLYVSGASGHVPLSGKMKSTTAFALTELDVKGKPAGTFDGTLTNGVLKGTYTDAKSKKARIFTTEPHRSDLPASFKGSYAGSLGGKLRIRARLEKKDATFGGVYRYAKSKEDLTLDGAIDKAAELTLTETTKGGKKTGRFEGFALSQYLIVGRWTSPDRTKSLPFLLESSNSYPEVVDLGGGVRVVPQEHYNDLAPHCTASVIYPVVEGGKGKAALNPALKKAGGGDDATKDLCEGATAEMPYTVEDDYSVTPAKLPYFGVIFHGYSFTGGAHGSWGATCKVADTDSGALFSLGSKMTPEARKKLGALVTASLKKEHGVDKLTEAGFFVDEVEITADTNVCLAQKGGIQVMFNPYEITPWVMGAPEVSVADDDARPLLPADLAKALLP